MGQRDNEAGRFELSRRDFLKVSAAGAAAAGALNFAPAPAMANIKTIDDEATTSYHTTCPYCSASCGQIIISGNDTGTVYDIHGDPDSPVSNGGLCAKGAGAYQLVTNSRRIGAWAGTHPVNPIFAYDATAPYADGIAYKRTGNGAWGKVALATAMDDIAAKLVLDRDVVVPGQTASSNSPHVQFYGSSHMNNEPNYLYRKIIATFGTSLVEHQARI